MLRTSSIVTLMARAYVFSLWLLLLHGAYWSLISQLKLEKDQAMKFATLSLQPALNTNPETWKVEHATIGKAFDDWSSAEKLDTYNNNGRGTINVYKRDVYNNNGSGTINVHNRR